MRPPHNAGDQHPASWKRLAPALVAILTAASLVAVSGATYTSASYTQSLQSALDKLGFKASDGSVATLQVP